LGKKLAINIPGQLFDIIINILNSETKKNDSFVLIFSSCE